MRFAIVAVCAFALVQRLNCQDIVFPKDDDNYAHVSTGKPVTESKPANPQKQCPENMIQYPGEEPNSPWICDCTRFFVYFKENASCHEVFTRGLCLEHEYVYLDPNETEPRCVKSPCPNEGEVMYKGACQQLHTKGGVCKENEILEVNETSLQVECYGSGVAPFVIIEAPKRGCPKGSRRNSLGICKLIL